MSEPRDYAVEAETPAEHLKNALQLLQAQPGWGVDLRTQLAAARARLEQALALLEHQP